MTTKGDQLFLWAIGVLQPTNATLVRVFLSTQLPDLFGTIKTQDVKRKLDSLNERRLITLSSQDITYLFSLTREGNWAMEAKLRRLRDKTRIYLLKDAAKAAQYQELSERGLELTGASPVAETRTDTQGRRPVGMAVGDPFGHPYWPSTFKQLKLSLSAGPTPRSDYSLGFEFYSFASIQELLVAHTPLQLAPPPPQLGLSHLALAIGVSARLLSSIGTTTKKERHYREFTIPKQSGGDRTIHAPRVFLKTIQRWLLDYILCQLPKHESSHAYARNKSIHTNAAPHVGKRFVANVDIVDFFNSVKQEALENKLIDPLGAPLAKWISNICTYRGCLPQGAPTSPALSNFFMYDFDNVILECCTKSGLDYTRYADDITISGDSRAAITAIIATVEEQLSNISLHLNKKKTRIASVGGQQNVTGVVVNVVMQPPRKLRRIIRAMFHNAKKDTPVASVSYERMCGYYNYLNSFEHCKRRADIILYEDFLNEIRMTMKKQ